ncbi:bombyxin G-1-like isoform X2 [Uranotaenia lowii]|uniref:bombyxin G-1-like isoform X2 n=1 Tax=Uranotaenia lowii TaxID=190385 RepID=UPI00247950A1|nr:bombyxin G-1-like isoform X2 [Uranotaenia lowii]
MRSASVSLFGTLLMVLLLVTLISLITLPAGVHGSPLPAPSGESSTASDGSDLMQHITRSRYCGRKLTETLALLCNGRYPMMGHHRTEYLSDQPQQPVQVEVATLPENGSHSYSRSKAHRRVRRGGIYDECCKKSCSYNELRSYCE